MGKELQLIDTEAVELQAVLLVIVVNGEEIVYHNDSVQVMDLEEDNNLVEIRDWKDDEI